MPLYEYQCTQCGSRFERIRKFSDPPLEACPTCGGKVEKLVSAPAFTFKGSGFYITDYKNKESGDSKESKGSKESKESKESNESKGSGESKESGAGEKAAPKSDSAPSGGGGGESSKPASPAPAAKPAKAE